MADFDNNRQNENQKAPNKDYTVLRDAKAGDAGFNAAGGAQSWVRMADGTEKCVLKNG